MQNENTLHEVRFGGRLEPGVARRAAAEVDAAIFSLVWPSVRDHLIKQDKSDD